MLRLINRKSLNSEAGSAVIGFAVGAPFVLFVFLAFIELTDFSMNTLLMQVKQNLDLMVAASTKLVDSSSSFMETQLDEVQMFTHKGSNWNLWRIRE